MLFLPEQALSGSDSVYWPGAGLSGTGFFLGLSCGGAFGEIPFSVQQGDSHEANSVAWGLRPLTQFQPWNCSPSE